MNDHTDAPAERHRLDGRVAVVTGAAGGIGTAIAQRLAALGAAVALLDLPRAAAELEYLRRSLPTRGLAGVCDIADPDSVAAAAERVHAQLGGCDILVNNAGVLGRHAALDGMDLADWDRLMAVNLRGPFLCTRAFGALMLARGRGSIVNIGSIAAGKPNASPAYSVSKAGVLALTRHTAVEWGPRGIRANAVSPGFIRTPLSAVHYASDEMLQWRTGLVPVRRLGTTGDIADAVAYLASDAAGFVNGQDLVVDGGFLETPLMHAQPKADQYGGHGH
ncbi:SDR family NAD(P)-dependent oxidoreductase [Xenophilus azovorans]|uniref:SDR family NAD(P)-dependent oxidoreductase n=1 Tax=Xenophilus azovorans TaxID=151755 RepID=UPI00068BD36B|nr:SDR family oxidoreductase [Xenophilus azovorans]